MYRLVDYDGQLCIEETQIQYDRPVEQKWLWPTALRTREFTRDFGEEHIGKEVFAAGNSQYAIKGFGLKIGLENGGQTHNIAFIETPIAPPKRRKNPRWVNGMWR